MPPVYRAIPAFCAMCHVSYLQSSHLLDLPQFALAINTNVKELDTLHLNNMKYQILHAMDINGNVHNLIQKTLLKLLLIECNMYTLF